MTRTHFCAALVGVSNVLACTNVELCVEPCRDPDPIVYDNVVRVEGTACTADPSAVVFPYKVLFVIDVSGSNRDSDPSDNRAKAVQRVIETYLENRAVYFGVVSFSDTGQALTSGFVRDRSVLIPDVIASLTRDEGGTNYVDTLALVYDFIKRDAEAMTEAERARTRYDIQWLSDGVPDPCVRPGPIVTATERLMELSQTYGFFDMKLNTTRLFFAGYPVAGCEELTPTDYLEPMATAGDGTFRVLTSDALDFKISFSEILRRFETRRFYVVNMNRVLWDDRLWPDSDGDGIRDIEEANAADALLVDSNSDGCTDRVDQELSPNAGLCASQCRLRMVGDDPTSLQDSDGDGLPDCAEQTLGYLRSSSDSDRDGFSDDLELKLYANPLDERTLTEDSDLDLRVDADEIRLGTNPMYPESDDTYVYAYSPLKPRTTLVEGTSCFDFSVDNVRLVQTEATATTAKGDNLLCLFVVQTSVDDPRGIPTVARACVNANYVETANGSVKSPSNGLLHIDARAFSLQYESGGVVLR